jgi:hypothetical protein
MTVPEDSLTALRNLFSPTTALPENFRPLQSPVPTSPLPPREPKAGATTNLGFDLPKERQVQTFLEKATQPDGTISLPPYIPMMIESADHLAATALKSWEMLCAEADWHREIFKSCSHSDGIFDYAQFQSYCNRLRLIHISLCCGFARSFTCDT